jgi:serine/threonine-protein kinase
VGRVLAERWEVGPRIGLGGMASVHRALDHRLGRQVAIKILHPHVAENPDSRTRLAREARAIAQLKHENVIEVYDFSIDDPDCTWLVTELIEGMSLRQFLDRGPKPMPEIGVMVATEVVRALRAAHAQGVVHRDVKPDNILVGKEGRPKLSDFGIAQVLSEQRMTLTGNLVGSPSYMSPEQANGKRTDHRTDLYSTGILLYRMVTGTLPFRGETAIDTIRKVSAGDYLDPVELEPDCAGPIAGIIRRALAPAIEERYQSADELLQDLGQVLADAGLSATWEELPRFFGDPAGYQRALRPRLAKDLEARAKALLDSGQETRAVDCFNRALSLGEGDQRTHDLVRELSKRRGKGRISRIVKAASIAIGAVLVVSGALVASDRALRSDAATKIARPPESRKIDPSPETPSVAPTTPPPPAPAPIETTKIDPATDPEKERVETKHRSSPVIGGASPPAGVGRGPEPIRSPVIGGASPPAGVGRGPEPIRSRAKRVSAKTEPQRPRASMIAAAIPPSEAKSEEPKPAPGEAPPQKTEDPIRPIYGTLQVGTKIWADIYVGGNKLGTAPDRSRFPLPPGRYTLRAEHPNCSADVRELTISAGEETKLRLNIVCPHAEK